MLSRKVEKYGMTYINLVMGEELNQWKKRKNLALE